MDRTIIESFFQSLVKYVLISLFIFAVDGIGFLTPLKRPLETALSSVSYAGESIVWVLQLPLSSLRYYRNGTAHIADLESRLAEATVERGQLAELKQENEAMRRLLDTPLPPEWDFVPAKVLGRSNQQLVIGAGSDQDISVGDTVIYQDLLVGKVKAVSVRQSRVVPITSSESRIAVSIAGEKIDGLVSGNSHKLMLSQVLQSSPVRLNQVVLSSGIDETKPLLTIGRVESVETNEEGVFQSGVVDPVLDLSQLQTVFVVIN